MLKTKEYTRFYASNSTIRPLYDYAEGAYNNESIIYEEVEMIKNKMKIFATFILYIIACFLVVEYFAQERGYVAFGGECLVMIGVGVMLLKGWLENRDEK